MELNFTSVETIPNLNASAAFQVDSGKVFKEDVDMVPTIIDKSLSYMPWGGDNMMPYNILKLIEDDETLSTCQQFNAEVCYGSGLKYDTEACNATVKQQVEDFLLDNALPSYFLGVCHDFKHFAFCVSVIILNTEGTRTSRSSTCLTSTRRGATSPFASDASPAMTGESASAPSRASSP